MSHPMRDAPPLPIPVRRTPRPGTVLLVNPFYAKDEQTSFGKHVLTPSLALTSLAGATPPDWRVSFWDENLLQGPIPGDDTPEVVGITVHLTFARRAFEIARHFRARGSLVVLGGPHVSSCPDECAPHADAICVGNGVPVWPRILADARVRRLESRYEARFVDYASEPLPDRSILPAWAFLTPLSLVATRGCHNRCDFCHLSASPERIRYQVRPVPSVVAEFRDSGQPYGVFVDNNLGSDRRYLRALCRGLAPLERIWSAAVSLDVSDDPSLVREMALAGCTGVFIGFESLSDEAIRGAGKRCPASEDWARRVEIFRRVGIAVNGSFVVGFDTDGPEVFERTVGWVERVRLECATYHILTPYPGTPFFARMKAQGRLLHEDWSLYDTGHCVFRPTRMSPAELEAGYAWMYRRTFSLASIWARRPSSALEMASYLGMALLYKRSNAAWPALIRHRAVHGVWRPLVAKALGRHLIFRRGLAAEEGDERLASGFPEAYRYADAR